MFKQFQLFIIILLLASLLGQSAAAQESETLGLLDLFELAIELPAALEYDNPFDPAQIDVMATFIAPDGSTFDVAAFYIQPYAQTCNEDCGPDGLEPSGEATWHVRFSPTQVGDWRYEVTATTPDDSVTVESGAFSVEPSDVRGFVRVSPNKRYFAFQNGDAYFPIGQNLGWAWDEDDSARLDTYLAWLDDLAANGANYARLFADTAWFIGLDWVGPLGDYTDEQVAAYRMDAILQAAAERGIYLQVVLIWHQAFIQDPGPPVTLPRSPARPTLTTNDFDPHSYNVINGGPLTRPENLYQDSATNELLRRRLRYMVARWGYSPHIFAWELITDVDRLPSFDAEQHMDFIRDLATYLRGIDPYGHLVTAGSRVLLDELLADDLFDFGQVRAYQRQPIEETDDHVADVLEIIRQARNDYDKPILLTEFSLNPWFEPIEDDPLGVHIQNTVWASALAGAAGSGMSQWWDTYIAPQDLYSTYAPLAYFAEDVHWNALDLQPVEVGIIASRDVAYEGLRVDNFNRALRGETPPNTIYQLTTDGVVPSASSFSSYLYGRGFNSAASRPQTLIVTPSLDTTLTIGVRDISPGGEALLSITIDDQPYAALTLTAGSENTAINIPLAAGQHRIVLDNLGEDWVELDYIEVTNYRAPLRAVALVDEAEGIALIWAQQRDYTWDNPEPRPAVLRYQLSIPNMPPGTYRVEVWDTRTGNVLGEELRLVAGASYGTLDIPLPPVSRQIALRAFRVDGPEIAPTVAPHVPTRTPFVRPSPTATDTATATTTPTPTPSPSTTFTPTATPSPTATLTPSHTASPTATATPSNTPSSTATSTAPATNTPSATLVETSVTTATTPVATTDAQVDDNASPTPIPRFTRTPRPDDTP